MRISLEVLTAQVATLGALDGVEPRSLSGDQAVEWVQAIGQTRQALDALLSAVTARVTELSSGQDRTKRFARAKGFADVGALVSEVAQVPRSDAGRLVVLAQAMADADAGSGDALTIGACSVGSDHAPALYAYLSQEVGQPGFSAEKAAIIRGTLKLMSGATPELEESLVDRAKNRPVNRVRVMCRQEFERVDHDGYLRHLRSLRKDRYVKFWDRDDGMVGLHGLLDPIDAIPLRQLVEDRVRDGMLNQRKVHPSERLEAGQLAADVLTDLAVHRMGCQDGPRSAQTTVVVTASVDAIVKGEGAAYCHGYAGPICVEMLTQLAFDVQVAPALTGTGGLPLYLGRSARFFTPAQKLAIALRDGGCARCGAPVARCDVHHIRFWSHDGPSDIHNGVLLCPGCHHRLHDFGWAIEVIDGEVWFVPPYEYDPQRERIPACSTRSPVLTG